MSARGWKTKPETFSASRRRYHRPLRIHHTYMYYTRGRNERFFFHGRSTRLMNTHRVRRKVIKPQCVCGRDEDGGNARKYYEQLIIAWSQIAIIQTSLPVDRRINAWANYYIDAKRRVSYTALFSEPAKRDLVHTRALQLYVSLLSEQTGATATHVVKSERTRAEDKRSNITKTPYATIVLRCKLYNVRDAARTLSGMQRSRNIMVWKVNKLFDRLIFFVIFYYYSYLFHNEN